MRIDDLLDWNPDLESDCSGLQLGYWLRIRVQPKTSLSLTWGLPKTSVAVPNPTSYTSKSTPPLNPSWAPTPTQGPLPSDCAGFYMAKKDDTCDTILKENPQITKDQFFAWNPILKGACDGLWASNYYCVFAGKVSSGPPTATVAPSLPPLDK